MHVTVAQLEAGIHIINYCVPFSSRWQQVSNWAQHNHYLIQYSFNFQIGYNGCFTQTVVMKDLTICAIGYPIIQLDMKLMPRRKAGEITAQP